MQNLNRVLLIFFTIAILTVIRFVWFSKPPAKVRRLSFKELPTRVQQAFYSLFDEEITFHPRVINLRDSCYCMADVIQKFPFPAANLEIKCCDKELYSTSYGISCIHTFVRCDDFLFVALVDGFTYTQAQCYKDFLELETLEFGEIQY